MVMNLRIQNRLVLVSLGAALVLLTGCNTDSSTSRTDHVGVPTTRQLKQMEKDVEKDLKPPVVIKPNLPDETGNQPVQPKQD